MKHTISDFLNRFPDDDSCIDYIFQKKQAGKTCTKCKKESKYYRVKSRKCYECGECGHQLYPLSGTIMHKSTTPIRLWFFAIYLFSQSKNGVSAKELERQLGVTYKTAFRIGHKIRNAMSRMPKELQGIVEMDESLYGGRAKGKRGWGAENKVCLFGMIERSGHVRVLVVEDRQNTTLIPIIQQHVDPEATLHTDKYRVYKLLPGKGFEHRIKDNKKIFTNCMEGYWGNFKKSIAGTHTWVTKKYLQNYLNEFEFRHNHRKEDRIFDNLIKAI